VKVPHVQGVDLSAGSFLSSEAVIESPPGPSLLVLIYTSPRKMCALAIGIGKGLAKHFNEKITSLQTMCIHKGASRCEIVFRKVH
jgi:hypothetical protein